MSTARKRNSEQYKKYKADPAVYLKRLERQKRVKEERLLLVSQMFVALSFFLMMLGVGVLSLTMPKPTVSEYEKRELATMPDFSVRELFWGSYLRDVELFYADTFPFREEFVQLAAVLDESRGMRLDGVRLIESAPPAVTSPAETAEPVTPAPQPEPQRPGGERPAVEEAPQEPKESSRPEEERVPYQVEDDGAIGEQTQDGLFIYKNKAMAIFGGNRELGTYYANTLSAYARLLGPDVRVYDAVIPTAIEFGLPERYKSVSNSEKKAIDHIYSELVGVTPIDAYSAIEAHAGEYLYYNTDHHWTGLGAYYAYTAYCQAAGLTPLSLEDYELRSLPETFLGTLYSQTNDSAVKDGADRVDYYVVPGEFEVTRYEKSAPQVPVASTVWADFASGSNSYSVFLHGDYPLIEMKTGVGNGRKAVVIKESFGNAFAPYLLAHYETVYVVDHRYYPGGLVSLIREKGINDVIFLKNVFAANTKFHIEHIENMMY